MGEKKIENPREKIFSEKFEKNFFASNSFLTHFKTILRAKKFFRVFVDFFEGLTFLKKSGFFFALRLKNRGFFLICAIHMSQFIFTDFWVFWRYFRGKMHYMQ